jgi:hypothetical protein
MTFHRNAALLTDMPSLADCFDLLINRFDPMDFIPAIIAKPAEIARIFALRSVIPDCF